MGAPNFASLKNASKYFVVLCNYEDEDGNEIQIDDWEYDDFVVNMHEHIKELGGEIKRESDGDRNYPSTILGSLSSSRIYGDIQVEVEIDIIVTSAYYEGATLDYIIKVYDGYQNLDIQEYDNKIDDILEQTFFLEDTNCRYTDMNIGMRKIQAKNALKWVEKEIETQRAKIEELFEKFAQTTLVKIGSFSNGETIYEKEI